MKKLHKTSLFTAIVIASTFSVKADTHGHLLVGFTKGSGKDVVFDLGPLPKVQNTWLPATLGISGTDYSWGVIGNNTNTFWVSSAAANLTLEQFNKMDSAINSIYSDHLISNPFTIESSSVNSWNMETIMGTSPDSFLKVYNNPNSVGATAANLFVMGSQGGASGVGLLRLDDAGLTFTPYK